MEKDTEIAGQETLTAEDLAAIEAMRSATPDQTANAGEGPPAEHVEEQPELPLDDKKVDDKVDDEDGDDDEITIDANGRARSADGKYVPKAAYLRVKDRVKNERTARETAEQRAIKAETRFATLAEIIDAQPDANEPDKTRKTEEHNPNDDADIDEKVDPLGALAQERARRAWDRKHFASEIDTVKRSVEESARAGANRNTEMAVYEAFKRDVAAFQSKEPAFEQALGHLVTTWKGHMKLMGETDEAKLDQAVAQTQRGILHKALANKQSPSKIMYEMALSMGFKPEAKEDDGKPKVSDAAKRIQKTQENMDKNRTLSGAGGGALSEDSQKSRLLAMDDDEFADYIKTVEGKATLRKLGMLG